MLRSIRHSGYRRQTGAALPTPAPIVMRQAGASHGVIYVAYGDRARASAQESIKSLKTIHPGIQVAVVSDQPINGAGALIIQPELDKGAREYKTSIYSYSPYDYTLYLDADTQVVGSLQAGYDILSQGWDMAAALDYKPTVRGVDHLPRDDVKRTVEVIGNADYPHYNTGLLFFRRCPEVEQFFCLWHEQWEVFHYRDQGAFVRALHLSQIKLYSLSWQWNTHRRNRATHVFHAHHSVARQP